MGAWEQLLTILWKGEGKNALMQTEEAGAKKVQSSTVDIKIRQWYISKQRAISMVLKCTQVFQLYISKQVPLDAKELFP